MPVAVRKREPPALAPSWVPQDSWDWVGLSPKGKDILLGEGGWVKAFQEEFFGLCRPGVGTVEWYPGFRSCVVIVLIRHGEAVRLLAHPTLLADLDPVECAREAFHMAFGGRRGVR